jgi:hypothetical protein
MVALRSAFLLGLLGCVSGVACSSNSPATSSPSGDSTQGSDPNVPAGGAAGAAAGAQAAGQTGPDGGPGSPGSPGTPGTPGTPGGPETPAVPYQHFDVNHVISTGQSNSVAHEGRPILSTQQPFKNLMFDVGVMTSGGCEREGCRTYQKPTGFLPLVEGDTFWYPVETMSAGLANEAAMLARTRHQQPGHDVLVSLAGRNGLTYWCLRRGGCNFLDPTYLNPFDENMKQVEDGKALAAAAGKSYVVRVATAIHGESDDYAYATNTQEFPLDGTDGSHQSVKNYADGLLEWQRDFEKGAQAITGQTLPVPLLISQFSGWNDAARSAVTQFQYEAMVRSGGKVTIVAPGYILDWHEDCRHYTSLGERRLGEYFGKAYARIVLEGRPWLPVHPTGVTIEGNVITARFHVPSPPLVLDTTRVSDPGNYGFEVVDSAGADLPITKVELAGADTVKVSLASAPAGKPKLRYAFRAVPHTCPGSTNGPRGNLRDSDATPSQHGYELFNWGVHFEVPVQ